MKLNASVLGPEEVAAVAAVLDSGYLTQGPRAAEFESLIREQTGVPHAFATSSATTGLHLALHALDVHPGDEVIIPAYSFPATANVVVERGAIPVFVDIDPHTFNLEPSLLESAITARTKVVMPVHAFGLVADMDPITAVAAAHGVTVLEDAACALGATYRGRNAGTLGDAGVFSFHPRKIITTGEGGMITTASAELAERITILRSHGGVRRELYLEFIDAGYNYRMSDINAAIGVVQMSRLDGILSRRRSLAAKLTELLADVEGAATPTVPVDCEHSWQSYVVLLAPDIDRDQVIREMRQRDVETTIGTYALHLQPYFRERFGIPDSALPHATRAHASALTLPLYPQLSDDDLVIVHDALKESIARSRVQG